MMDEATIISYFEKNKKEIQKLAKKLSQKENKSFDEEYEEIKDSYYNLKGTFHKEKVIVKGTAIQISDILNQIRNLPYEVFQVYDLKQDRFEKIDEIKGNPFEVKGIDLNMLTSKIVSYRMIKMTRTVNLFFIHNHPFMFKAFPSLADAETANTIMDVLYHPDLGNNFIDFSIVTPFDYYSVMQDMYGPYEENQ